MSTRRRTTLLTNLELAVMRVVWAAAPEPLTVRAVVDGLNEGRRKPLAYNTVQTMLNILRDKGVVECRRGTGRAFDYRSVRSQEEVTTSMVGDLVERLFDGHVQPLLLHLVEQERLSRDELASLKDLIEDQLDDEEAEQ